ncbi:MAG: DinB family protein [Ignavibacteria bacterium]|nr:DinB family protein [Ignavibacteria bacterium]
MFTESQLLKLQLEDARRKTLKGIEGVTKEQLFAPPVSNEDCIGAYLMHLAECEIGWYENMTGEKLPQELKDRNYYGVWIGCPAEFAHPPKEPIEVEEYISAITDARKFVLDFLDKIDVNELDEILTFKNGVREVKMTKRDIINRLIAHENHTRGQMFLLMRMGGIKTNFDNIWGIRLEQ